MRKIFLYIALFLSVAIPSSAQFVAITDTGVTDASGAVLVSGNECFTPVNNAGTPIPAEYPGGTITKTPKCAVITNGTMAPIQLVSSAVTSPVNLCYQRTVVDNNTGKYVIGPKDGFGCVQPTVATNMNTVLPSTPGVSLQTTGPTGPIGPQGIVGPVGPVGPIGTPADGVDVSSYPGADIGAQIAAAQAAAGVAPNLFRITQPGTLSTQVTLGSGHSLLIDVPITMTASISINGDNTLIKCGGPSATITIPSATSPIIINNAAHVRITGCTVTAPSYIYDFVTSGGTVQDLTVDNNDVSYGNGLNIAGGSITNVSFYNNKVSNSGYGLYIHNPGIAQYIAAWGNQFTNVTDGITDEGGNGAAYPSYATILAAGHGHSVFSGNTCSGVQVCVWNGMAFDELIEGNVSESAADVAFDAEGSANISMNGNTCYLTGNACFSQFFTGFGNKIDGNLISMAGNTTAAVIVKNASADPSRTNAPTVTNNTFNCLAPTLPCLATSLDAGTGFVFSGNKLTDSIMTYASVEQPGFTAMNNFVVFTQANETTAGFQLPEPLLGIPLIASGNTIEVMVSPQPAGSACIAATSQDYNNSAIYYITNNTCLAFNGGAPFPIDMHLTNNGGNNGVGAYWYVSNNNTNLNAFTFDGAGVSPTFPYLNNNCTFQGGCASNQTTTIPSQFGPATAPSGGCGPNGIWVFSQDGHATFCAAGVWTTKI